MSRWKRLIPLFLLVLFASCGSPPAPNVPPATVRTSKTAQQPLPCWEAPWTEPKEVEVLYRQFLELSKSPEDDCLPCLLAVRLTDVQEGRNLNASGKLVADHLRFRQTVALDQATGFACTEMDPRTGRPLAGARGCTIAGSICFLGHLAPAHCRDLYARFKEGYWIEQGEGSGKIAGFREWPRAHDGFMDIDSGPIVAELGAAASGFGLGASRFARDLATHEALLDSLDKAVVMIDTAQTASAFSQGIAQLMQAQGIVAESDVEQLTATFKGLDQDLAVSKDYRYRHLMANAVAFYCLTWRPWCEAAVGEQEVTGIQEQGNGR